MKKQLVIVLILGLSFTPIYAQKKIAITIDDLPVVTYGKTDIDQMAKITNGILNHLNAYNVEAIGFVNEGKLYVSGAFQAERLELLRLWLEAGQELGNHTYGHLNLHKVGISRFTEDITKGAHHTKALTEEFSSPYRYFRHPFLRAGNSQEQADSLIHFLTEHNYIEAPVTIDNADYLFAKAYHEAYNNGDKDQMKHIGTTYVRYMEDVLKFYERNSQDLFGRQISHILLMHANMLNSDYLGELLEMYKSNGYEFCTLAEALEDPAYETEVTVWREWGISWLHRWALSQGIKGDFFKGEPEPKW